MSRLTASEPATKVASVTPDDNNDLPVEQIGGFVRANTAGDVAVVPLGDSTSHVFSLAAGETFGELRVRRILATGTTVPDADLTVLY